MEYNLDSSQGIPSATKVSYLHDDENMRTPYQNQELKNRQRTSRGSTSSQLGSKSGLYIHTSSFSLPVERRAPYEDNQAESDLSRMLQDALATCARLSQENSRLESENRQLTDKLSVVSEMASSNGLLDAGAIDSQIGAIRGRLLEHARGESDALRSRCADLEVKNNALNFEITVERARSLSLRQTVEKMGDVEALSEARARAVERLDEEVITLKAVLARIQSQNNSMRCSETEMQMVQQERDRLMTELEQSQARYDKLAERLADRGLESWVQRANVALPPRNTLSVKSASPNMGSALSENGMLDICSSKEAERLRRSVSALERENTALRKDLDRNSSKIGDPSDTSQLKDSLKQAVAELRMTTELKQRERIQWNGLLAAYSARVKHLEACLKKEMAKRKDYKFYRFIAKKCQAEMAAMLARSRQVSTT